MLTTSHDDVCMAPEPSAPRWVPVKLAYVTYPEGDLVGHLLAWTSLAPVLLIFASLSVFLFRREVQIVVFLAGMFVNEIINITLKKMIGQRRPCSQHDMTLQHTDLGMPSSHAQFIWFFSFYLSLFVTLRVAHLSPVSNLQGCAPSFSHSSSASSNSSGSQVQFTSVTSSAFSFNKFFVCWWKLIIIIVLFVLAAVVSYSRVYLQYHDWPQIIAGTCCGIVVACLWYVVTSRYLVPFYPRIVSSPLAEFLMLRDSSLIPNILVFEYVKARAEAQTRMRKQSSSLRN